MRIAIVNDLAMATAALRIVVESIDGAVVAWTAADGKQAVDRCRADTPDLILMDMIMPVMDGVEATRRIMQECPCPIVVVTATVTGNASLVFDALGHGALDAVQTPSLGRTGDMTGAEDLIRKIRAVERLVGPATRSAPRPAAAPPARAAPSAGSRAPLIAIGSSTGGPQALVHLLSALPCPLPAAVVIIQHVDPAFAPGLADWLATETGHAVAIARAGDAPAAGAVVVAATADHLVLDTRGRFRHVREPIELPYRPSADVFFASILAARCEPGVAVLLTGMGRDGAAGLRDLRQAGWHTIAQDKATSVVWGMPGAAVELGAAVQTLPINAIGGAIGQRLFPRTPTKDQTT